MTDNEITAPVRIGDLLADRYRVEALIGRGGMATVYRAADERLGRAVALKVFTAGVDATSDARQASEVRLLASFDHPGLVAVYDRIAGDPTALVMRLVEGEDLRTRVQRGTVPVAEATLIGAEVAEALAYVHDRGVLHRDVTPANVLLAAEPAPGEPRALLADFGIARLVDAATLTATGTVLGTATYLSPEQAAGQAVGPATDVYSLSLVLLEAVTGERAYPGGVAESLVARLSADPVIPATVDPELATLLRAGTAREPGDRPTAAELAASLRATLAGGTGPTAVLPVAVPPTDPPATEALDIADELPATERLAAVDDLPATELLAAADAPAAAAVVDDPQPTRVMTAAPAPPAVAEGQRRRSDRRFVAPLIAIAAVLAIAIGVVSALALSGSLGQDTPPAAEPVAETPVAETPVEDTVSDPVTPEPEPEVAAPTLPDTVAGPLGTALGGLQQALAGTGLEDAVVGIAERAIAGDLDGARDLLDQLEEDIDDSFDDDETKEIDKLIKQVEKALEGRGDTGPKGPKGD